MGKNGVLFVADTSLFVHIDNNFKDVLILCTKPRQRSDVTTLAAEAKYSVNFTQPRKRFVSNRHYNESNNFLFVNSTKICQFKERYSEINYYALFIGRISKDFTINCMIKIGLNVRVNIFCIDFNHIDSNDILDIHNYFRKKIR